MTVKSINCRTALVLVCGVAWLAGAVVGRGAPVFVMGGHEREAAGLSEMLALHLPGARSECALWDPWLPMSTLWAATGPERSARSARGFYRRVLLERRMDGEGYVSMQQHRGMAHSEGWPFPGWQQSTGRGWHFSVVGDGWAVENFRQEALTSAEGWEIAGGEVEGIDPAVGLKVRATGETVTLTTPVFACGTVVAPFIRLEWAADGLPPGAAAAVEWRLEGETGWVDGRRAEFPVPAAGGAMEFANVPVHRQAGYDGMLTRLRVVVPARAGATIVLKSVLTAIDTRHPVTNSVFLQACADYFGWTGDLSFLAENLPRMRRAMRFALDEFDVRQGGHVRVGWVGHDGRSGLGRDAAGKRVLRPGLGVGNNYWDLLPFGGRDALATMQVYVALRRMAGIEREVAEHAEWRLGPAADGLTARELDGLAERVRDDFRTRFWNAETGRFVGWIDVEGGRHDFGFTFLNTEAVHHGLATEEQERAIFDWLDGRRLVEGDTSQGGDIYHWRFGPRSTTRRNTETYVWAWTSPETLPWGGQVQDGGAVLGFTYYDLMARLRVLGPDGAWQRLREVLAWFGEVQAEGGYRAYYAVPGRGTLQGGGPAGGLGFDREFMESVLVPQVMVYGFLGAEPRPGGLSLAPRLPSDLPRVGVDGLQVQDHVFEVVAEPRAVVMTCRSAGDGASALWLPAGRWAVEEEGVAEADRRIHAFAGREAPLRLEWKTGQRRIFRRL